MDRIMDVTPITMQIIRYLRLRASDYDVESACFAFDEAKLALIAGWPMLSSEQADAVLGCSDADLHDTLVEVGIRKEGA